MASFQMRHKALKQSKHLWALWELVRQYLKLSFSVAWGYGVGVACGGRCDI